MGRAVRFWQDYREISGADNPEARVGKMSQYDGKDGEDLDPMLGGRQSSVLQTLRAARLVRKRHSQHPAWSCDGTGEKLGRPRR